MNMANLAAHFAELRNDFPMLKKTMHGKPLIYFDSAATAQKPQCVIDAITQFYSEHYGTVHRAVYELSIHATQEFQEVRKRAAKFLNAAKPAEIIYTRGTTESINLIATSFGKVFVNQGDEIIITEMEHHSNIVPWQMMCEDRGAILKVVQMNEQGELILESLSKLLSSKTKIVAVAHVANSIGTINPIKEIAAMVHHAGAKLLVDGAQSAPHLTIDVQDLDVDFYVLSGHKIYGPTGIGLLYGKEALLDAMPPYQGGGDMIDIVTFPKTTYNVLPMKFEAGTPMIAEVLGIGAAIDYLQKIGLSKIQQWEHELLLHATQAMQEIPGLRIVGTASSKGAIISFVVEGIHPLDLGTMLDLKGIALRTGQHCAQPTMRHFGVEGTARVSFGLYNNISEIDAFIIALKDVIKLLK